MKHSTLNTQHSTLNTQHYINQIYLSLLCFFFIVSNLNAQTCTTNNPWPPIANECFTDGGDVRSIFLTGYCGTLSGGTVSGGPMGMVISDKTITIDGTLYVDQDVEFINCTLRFTENGSIKITKSPHWYQLDVLDPGFNFNFKNILKLTDCILEGCYGATWGGISFGAGEGIGNDLIINGSTIKDANHAITGVFGAKQGSLLVENSIFNNNIESIVLSGDKIRNLTIKDCNFINSQVAINVSGLNRDIGDNGSNGQTRKRFSFFLNQTNEFRNCLYAIKADNIQGLQVENQIMENVGFGVYSNNMRGNLTQRETFRLVNNMIEANYPFEFRNTNIKGELEASVNITGNVLNSIYGNAILINNLENGHLTINNNTFSDFQNAVYLLNLKLNDFNLNSNQFSDNYHGVRLLRTQNLLEGLGSMANNTFFPNSNTEQRVSLRSPEIIRIEDNTFDVDGNVPNSVYNVFDITDGTLMDFRDNTFNVSRTYPKSTINIANSMGTEFCCNILNGGQSSLHVFGTNRDTKIKNTTFRNNDMTLEQSMIGPQVDEDGTQFGNRWQGATNVGELISSNLAQAPLDNQFRINELEGNATLGMMKPQMIIPSNISAQWFFDEDMASETCENQMNCGFMRFRSDIDPESWISPPDSIPNLGTCYPQDLDRDGDGICDDSDPDPDDACVPIMQDQDGDGICDPLDPDPQDGCNPIYRDTDRDGICDTSDPDPWDPCLPNFVDTDNDGICDRMDPAPTNPGVYNIPVEGPSSLVSLDRNGDALIALGYNTSAPGLNLSISDLEAIANMTFTNVDYEELNYIESKSYLYKILLSSPYYRLLSPVLENAYQTLGTGDIGTFEEFNMLSKSVHKSSNLNRDDLLLKDLYLNRLSNVAAHLTYDNGDSLFIEEIEAVIDLKTNELYSEFSIINVDITQKKNDQYNEVSSLPVNYDALSELKEFYNIDLGYAISSNPTSLSQSQQNVLWQIGNSCPLVFGKAVYLAQDLLVSEGLYTYEDFNMTCTGPITRSKTKKDFTNSYINVFPNPTNGQLHINADRPIHHLAIYSMTGQLLSEISNAADNTILDLSAYKYQGFVTLKAIDFEGRISTHKVILIND